MMKVYTLGFNVQAAAYPIPYTIQTPHVPPPESQSPQTEPTWTPSEPEILQCGTFSCSYTKPLNTLPNPQGGEDQLNDLRRAEDLGLLSPGSAKFESLLVFCSGVVGVSWTLLFGGEVHGICGLQDFVPGLGMFRNLGLPL